MKKKMLKSALSLILRLCAILTIFITLNGLDFAFAQGATLTISCTVPSIAGVNAPMIEEKSTRAQDTQQAAQNQGYTLPKDIKTPSTSMLQADKEITTQAASPMLIKTFYVR